RGGRCRSAGVAARSPPKSTRRGGGSRAPGCRAPWHTLTSMPARVRSTNVGVPRPDGDTGRTTGIDKRPVPSLEVFRPGPRYGDGSGVVGDYVGDSRHHGGAHKAVYAFSREELDRWEGELGRGLPDGIFGENLTTEGL